MVKLRTYIVGNESGFAALYRKHDIEIVDSIKHSSFLTFTGGEDISPILYGQTHHPTTHNNMLRDKKESIIFNLAKEINKPMVGVCRGGQFLNIMCGGDLYQDVDGHAGSPHLVQDCMNNTEYLATSTHHQMMETGREGLTVAYCAISKRREKHINGVKQIDNGLGRDPEVIYYDNPNCLCIQWHPEYKGWEGLGARYIDYIKTYLFS